MVKRLAPKFFFSLQHRTETSFLCRFHFPLIKSQIFCTDLVALKNSKSSPNITWKSFNLSTHHLLNSVSSLHQIEKLSQNSQISNVKLFSQQLEQSVIKNEVPQSFYKRPLPNFLVPFSSPEGKNLFKEALTEKGLMESYWPLAEQFQTQSEPAYCGLAALSMVLNALQIDPQRMWKVPWRWFSEDLLDCCAPLEEVKKNGITFHEFACLAKCNGAEVTTFRSNETDEETFRQHIKEACSKEGTYLVVSFARSVLGQTGDGHFAAIAGYHKEKDLVLILDTAKFKYPAFWCPVSMLFEALKPLDAITNLPRGYFILTKSPNNCSSVCDTKNYTSFRILSDNFQKISSEQPCNSVEEIIALLLNHFLDEIPMLASRLDFTFLLNELTTTKLHQTVSKVIQDKKINIAPIEATIFLYACPSQLFKEFSSSLRKDILQLRHLQYLSLDLSKQIETLRDYLIHLQKHCNQEKSCKI